MFGSGGGGTGGAGGGVLTLEITDVLVVEGEMEWNLFAEQSVVCLFVCLFKEALSVLMLCAPVFIFTSGSSALLGHPHCGLLI